MKQIKTAILGATGLVGQQFINILSEHPYFSIDALIASEKNSGKNYADVVRWKAGYSIPQSVISKRIDKFSIELLKSRGIKIIFSALPSNVSLQYEKELRDEGFYIFSNSSSYRMKEDVPIIIPEVNPNHIFLIEKQKKKHIGFIITNPNCSTTGIVSVLKPLSDFGLESVYISTYQSISGAGINGISAINAINNIIPYIKDEEQKIEDESRKILSEVDKNDEILVEPSFKIISNCMRVPSLYSHLISMIINVKDDVSLSLIEKKLSEFSNIPEELNLPLAPKQYIHICKEKDRPQPALDFPIPFDRDAGMIIKLGRLEKIGKTIKLFILFNNTLRGAAGASVLNAELVVEQKLVGDL